MPNDDWLCQNSSGADGFLRRRSARGHGFAIAAEAAATAAAPAWWRPAHVVSRIPVDLGEGLGALRLPPRLPLVVPQVHGVQ